MRLVLLLSLLLAACGAKKSAVKSPAAPSNEERAAPSTDSAPRPAGSDDDKDQRDPKSDPCEGGE
jgi:hypothetical protein